MSKVLGWLKIVVVVMILSFGLLMAGSVLPIPGNYSVYMVLSGSMEPAIGVGSVVVVKPQDRYAQNDVITVKGGNPKQPVTHRIVEVLEDKDISKVEFVTKGDANEDADTTKRNPKDVIGRVMFSIPLVGYPMKWAQEPVGFLLLIVVPGVLIIYHELLTIATEIKKKWQRRKKAND